MVTDNSERETSILETNVSKKIKSQIVADVTNLEFTKPRLDKCFDLIYNKTSLLSKDSREGLSFPAYNVVNQEPRTYTRDNKEESKKSLVDIGRTLIFLSENKGKTETELAKQIDSALIQLQQSREQSSFRNYQNYLSEVRKLINKDHRLEADDEKLKSLLNGGVLKQAFLDMITPTLDSFIKEEGGQITEENSDQILFNTFSPADLSGSYDYLPQEKIDKIPDRFKVNGISSANLKINIPREGAGAGKCGDIENAFVEGGATLIPVNDGEIFIAVSKIGNMYALADTIVQGIHGGILFPYVFYSIPRSMLIKLSLADHLPEKINGITNISFKPVREFAPSQVSAQTINMGYTRNRIIENFSELAKNTRKRVFGENK